MKTKDLFITKLLLLILLTAFTSISTSQTTTTADTTAKKIPQQFDYSYLQQHPEHDTKIYGTVNKTSLPKNTQLFAKNDLFGASFSYINTGAEIALLNTELPLNKSSHRMLVKVISDP